jgi:F-type H+-transporting ATPase subunit epsilon
MQLDLLLPSRVLLRKAQVQRIVAETTQGAFGLLPQRLDCVAALVPGILCFETAEDGEVFVAVDEGVLVKAGDRVRVSVRRAMQGTDLAGLRATVEQEFRRRDDEARSMREVLTKLETGFVARLARIQKGTP